MAVPLIRRLAPVLPVLGSAAAAIVVWWAAMHVFRNYHYRDIVAGLAHIGRPELVVAGVLCIANYSVLTLYDLLAFQYIGKQLGYRRIGFAAFVSYTFSHNIGFAALSGGAVRLRLYTGWGLSPGEVARIFLFSGLHFWLGLLVLAAASLAVRPDVFPGPFAEASWWVSAGCTALLIAYLGGCARGGRVRLPGSGPVHLPRLSLAVKGVSVAAVDWLLAAGVLYALLPPESGVAFFFFLNAFVAAQIAGVVSNIPGGLGVFESVMVLTVGHTTPASGLLGILVVFRLIYYLIPFCIGLLALIVYELHRRRDFGRAVSAGAERVLTLVIPHGLTVATFFAGVLLLVSGATPALPDRLEALGKLIPLYLLELSHFVNSLVGILLVVLAWGVRKRLSAAYWSAMGSAAVGAIVSLTKGLDYEEACYLALVMTALYLGRRHFSRQSALMNSVQPRVILAATLILACSVLVGLFSYKHVEYSYELWWQFELEAEASRFLRATLGAGVLLVLLSLRLVLRRGRTHLAPP